jgi:alginate O-acetyltransferase complex protein AlgI
MQQPLEFQRELSTWTAVKVQFLFVERDQGKDMLFNSSVFLIFVALFASAYFITHNRSRLWVICLASYIFYGWWDWRFTGLLFGMTVICWYSALRLSATPNPRSKRLWLVTAISTCLVVLGFFKYFNFFEENTRQVLTLFGFDASWPTMHIVLPVGISFFMFQGLSYVVDVARGDLPVEKSLLKVATFKAFFPQLVAGPIVRAHDFMPQLDSDRRPTANDLIIGVCLMVWGYVMKVGMADSLGAFVDQRFGDPQGHSPASMALGVLFYAFQIYGDFGGYSLIAIGLARCFGFHFLLNFRRPYFADSLSDFWKRWHISLSSWLRDYLYIPLGGNRCSSAKTNRNLMLTMLLGGLWHGAAWNFVAWGALHGSYLCLERLIRSATRTGPPHVIWRIAKRAVTTVIIFVLVCVGWVLFRAHTLTDALLILSRVATWDAFDLTYVPGKFQLIKGLFLISLVVVGDVIWSQTDLTKLLQKHWWVGGVFCGVCGLVLAFLGTFHGNSFIYFQF